VDPGIRLLFSAYLKGDALKLMATFICNFKSRHFGRLPRPIGQAAFEYLLVLSGVVLVWLAIERSPHGFAAALLQLLSQYKFLLSIPW
jgi:uncharacterized membrane-anchored protein